MSRRKAGKNCMYLLWTATAMHSQPNKYKCVISIETITCWLLVKCPFG